MHYAFLRYYTTNIYQPNPFEKDSIKYVQTKTKRRVFDILVPKSNDIFRRIGLF